MTAEKPWRPVLNLANTKQGEEFDMVVLSGFKSEEHARQFAERLLMMGMAELPQSIMIDQSKVN